MVNHQLGSTEARDLIIIIGHIRAKIGGLNEGQKAAMRVHGVRKMNEKGEMFAETCVNNRIVFSPKKSTKQLMSPDHVAENKQTTFLSAKSSEGPWKASEQEEEQMQHQITTSWQGNSNQGERDISAQKGEG